MFSIHDSTCVVYTNGGVSEWTKGQRGEGTLSFRRLSICKQTLATLHLYWSWQPTRSPADVLAL